MKYKFFTTTIIVSLFSTFAFSQEEKGQTSIGLFYSIAGGNISGQDKEATLSFDFKKVSGVGISLVHNLNKSIAIESGIDYTLFDVEQVVLGILNDTTKTNLNLIQIPLLARATFSEYFFMNGGLLLDFDMNSTSAISRQSGLGLMGGVGGIYEFKSGVSIFANPYVKLHSLLRFNREGGKNNVMEYGMRVGVAYKF